MALTSLDEYNDGQLGEELAVTAARVQDLAPDVVGFSLGLVAQGVVLTYVSTVEEAALLDAAQYLDGGPCVAAAAEAQAVLVDHADLFDEGRWQVFAQMGADFGVRSTLSLPVLDGDVVVGGVNLYGGLPDTFEGRAEDLAELFGAWAPGAISNADLGFTTRLEAAKAPALLEEMHTVALAVGVLVAAQGISPEEAERRLTQAAARAGIGLGNLAGAVIREHVGGPAAALDESGTAE